MSKLEAETTYERQSAYRRGYATGNKEKGDRWRSSFLSARMLIGYDIKKLLEIERINYENYSEDFKKGYQRAIDDVEKSRFYKEPILAEPKEEV